VTCSVNITILGAYKLHTWFPQNNKNEYQLTLQKEHVMNRVTGKSIILLLLLTCSNLLAAADRTKLLSQFTTDSVIIDGQTEPVWDIAESLPVAISMTANLSAPAPECKTSGTVRSLWDGAILYLLIDVNDTDITTTAKLPGDQDGVEIYGDFYNDKMPKNEEDDWLIRINCVGDVTGSGAYQERLQGSAVFAKTDSQGKPCGYVVELAIYIGGIPMQNGSKMGFEFCINDAVTLTQKCQYRIFWSDGNNKGLDDNSRWGVVKLSGWDGKTAKALDTFLLRAAIYKAEKLPRGIWVSETELDNALAAAKQTPAATKQKQIDHTAAQLDNALQALRRSGKYPDPFALKTVNSLPDPFTFFNGKKVVSVADWTARRAEILDLAQYYEYGYLPKPPQSVTAVVNDDKMTITVQDKGVTAAFEAVLTIPTVRQCGKSGPYPVIVSIDFWPQKANPVFLKAGYAVLSIIYTSVASDNYDRQGAFYELYPYNVTTGHDAGTLLAWAWGASRAVDALTWLTQNDAAYKNKFALDKLVVTGFSRCGKAALAAGLFDERFGVVNPGASGCGGCAVYRYDSFGNTPHRSAPFGNVYDWGVSTGCEVLGDKTRHQGHNANEMLPRFLNPPRIYKTDTHGYAERLPYDHHEIIAAIAPRAVLITTANNDYANGAEGDCIGLEGAKPVYQFLGVPANLALNIRTSGENSPWGGGHFQDDAQIANLVHFADMVFFGVPLTEELQSKFYTNPYLSTFDKYYGELEKMMPWLKDVAGGK